jgi:hypothetical protein
MAHDVFVSHSHKDKPVADAVVAGLEGRGIRCWMAPRDITPGKTWGEAINSAIEGSRFMVIILSSHSNRSNQVVREVERAVANDVIIIPFRIENIDPTGAMAYFLSSEHWLDAITPPLKNHIEKLANTIEVFQSGEEAVIPQVQTPPKPSIPWKWLAPTLGALALILLAIFAVPKLFPNKEQVTEEPASQGPTEIFFTETPAPTITPTPPPSFELLGRWKTSREVHSLFVEGDLVYVANSEDGLRILDISDPSQPVEIGSISLDYAENVIIMDDIAYVVVQGQLVENIIKKSYLVMIDVQNPQNPRLLGEFELPGSYSHSASNFAVADSVAYLTTSSSLTAVDVSDPAAAEILGEFSFQSNISSPGVTVVDGIAYLQGNHLHVVDFSDPANPLEIGAFDNGWGASIEVIDQIAYIAGWNDGLVILDVSDPTRPIKLGQFKELIGNYELIPRGAASRLIFLSVSINGNTAYLNYNFGIDQDTTYTTVESGVIAIDISDPENPQMITKYTDVEQITSLFAVGEYVLITDGSPGVLILSKPH